MALTLGIPVSQGALLLGYLSISAIFGKLLSGRLADLPRVRRLYIFVISATVLSVSSMCVTAAKSYHGLLAYTLVAGFFDGCFVVTVPLITQDIAGKELMAKAIGIQYGLVAFPLTLGPPVLGKAKKCKPCVLHRVWCEQIIVSSTIFIRHTRCKPTHTTNMIKA